MPGRLGLGGGQADLQQLGIGADQPRGQWRGGVAGNAEEQGAQQQRRVFLSPVGMRAGIRDIGDAAGRPDPAVAPGAQARAGGDAVRGRGDAGGGEVQRCQPGPGRGGQQQMGAGDPPAILQQQLQPFRMALHPHRRMPFAQGDPFRPERFAQQLHHFRLQPRQERAVRDNGGEAAQALMGLGQFQCLRPMAQDQEVPGRRVQVEAALPIEIGDVGQPLDGGQQRRAARRHHGLAETPVAAGGLQAVGGQEMRRGAGDEIDPHAAQPGLRGFGLQGFRGAAEMCPDTFPVDGQVRGAEPESPPLPQGLGSAGGGQQRVQRQALPQPPPAGLLALEEGDAPAQQGREGGGGKTGGAGADHGDVGLRHAPPLMAAAGPGVRRGSHDGTGLAAAGGAGNGEAVAGMRECGADPAC